MTQRPQALPLADAVPSGWWRVRDAQNPARRRSEAPFIALIAFTAVLLVAPQQLVPALAPLRPAFLAAVWAAATCLVEHLRRGSPLDFGSREVRIAGALGAWAIATFPLSYWPGGSLGFIVEIYFKTLVVFWILCGTVDDAARLRRLLWTLSVLTVPLAATGIANYLGGQFTTGYGPDGMKRIAGYAAPLTGNPNDLALLLNLLLPLAVALAAATPRLVPRLLLGAIVAADAVAIVLTFSRAGFLTLGATTVALLSRSGRAWRVAVVLGPFLGLAAWFAPSFLPSGYVANLETIANVSTDSTGSAQERLRDMGAATHVAFAHPVAGVGIGMNSLALNDARGATWRRVHNVYLEQAVELGLPGLALFLALMWGCFRCARSARALAAKLSPPSELVHFATGIEASLVGFAVAACFHPVSYHFYFYYVAALAIATKAIVDRTIADRGVGGAHA